MADHLQYSSTTGHLLYGPNGHLAHTCGASDPCAANDSSQSTASVTITGTACDCMEGTYSFWGIFTAGDWGGEWNGGYCTDPEPTDFLLRLVCTAGVWTGYLISYLSVTQFQWQAGNANTLALSGDQLTGAIEMTGLDATGDNGLDCSGCTLTATF